MSGPLFLRSVSGTRYVRQDAVIGLSVFGFVQTGFLALALHDAHGWIKFHADRANENQMNRILVDKVESYGSLIVSKLPNIEDR